MTAKPKTKAFDEAEYLDSDETIAAFLEDAIASGDPAQFQDALQVVARARGMTEIAKSAGLGRASLYKALSADGHPQFDTVQRVLTALGVRLAVVPA